MRGQVLRSCSQETTKDPEDEGSRSYQGSVIALFRCTKATKTHEQRHFYANKPKTGVPHFCLNHLKNEILACKTR